MRSSKDVVAASPLSRVERDGMANDAADEIVELVRRMDFRMIAEKQQAFLTRTAGVALANRFMFACLDDDPDTESAVWVFSPVDLWAEKAQIFTLPVPLEGLLPEGALEIYEGVWMWPDNKRKADRAALLMAEGFIWDEAFQMRVDSTQTGMMAGVRRMTGPHNPQNPKGPAP